MKDLLALNKSKRIIFLSGDRHISEFSILKEATLDYPLMDFTSSGLTHAYTKFSGEPNPFRVGAVIAKPSFGIVEINFSSKQAHFKMMGDKGTVLQESVLSY